MRVPYEFFCVINGADKCVANGGMQLFDRANGRGTSDSLFKTASGKTVDISPLGLMRAKTLLGLENEEHDFISPAKSCVTNETSGNRSHSGGQEKDAEPDDPKSVSSNQVKFVTIIPGSETTKYPMLQSNCSSNLELPPIKFHTAGGRSISVSGEALKRARSLLGDPDKGEVSTEPDASVSASASCLEIEKGNIPPKFFVSPLRSSPHKLQLCSDSNKTSSGENLIEKFNEEASDCAYKLDNLACLPKPKNGSTILPIHDGVNMNLGVNGVNDCSARTGSRKPLVDVSNRMHAVSENKQLETSKKRKFGRRQSPATFKRPRSRFSAPLINNGSTATDGM